jgi:polyhydroxybutyrate depolymerase
VRAFLTSMLLTLAACAPEHVVQGRAYDLQVPAGADGPLPLLILAHGYGANGFVQDVVFPLSKQVGAKKFLYALPNGTEDAAGSRFWNATEACCNFGELPVDDVAFFRALIADVKSQHPVQKVFIVGHSNGAFMALRLACDAPDAIDGVVAVSGSTWLDPTRCGEGRAVPMLMVHGTDDKTIPYAGRPGRYPGAVETSERFARRAGCTGDWEELDRADFLGASAAETRRARRAGCPARADVELWSMEGTGHIPQFDGRWTGAVIDWLTEHAR